MNSTRMILAAAILLVLVVPLSTSNAEPEGKKHPEAFTVEIPMRDGKTLAADIFLPKTEGKFPTILIMTPYNRKHLAAAIPAAAMKSKLIDREHYAFVVVDWRGFYGSKDAGGDVGKAQSDLRGKDGYDTIEWLAGQKWSNGKVGMWGSSALGKIQYWTAIQQPPHLVCICPMVCQHGYFHGRYYHGGVYRKCNTDILEQVGFTGATKGIRKYPAYGKLWKYAESPAANKYSKINLPVLIIGGWYDTHTEGVLQTFNAIRKLAGPEARKNVKMLIGPWEHCFAHAGPLKVGELEFPEAKAVSEKEAVRFFDYWLRGKKDNGYDKEPAVRYFQMGVNKWKSSPSWPPANLKEVTYFLQTGGKLSTDKPDEDCQPDTFRYDPNDLSPTVGGMTVYKYWDRSAPKIAVGPMDQRARVESRKDHVSYSTEALEKDVVVRDAAKVKLYVSSNRVDTDFAVRLCDVYPDGRSMLITDGIHRMRFRESLEKEKLMKPGEVYRVIVVLTPTAHTFRKKHRIRILVSSSNFPRFDRNPNNGEHFLTDKKKALVATNKIYHDTLHLSALTLPVPGADKESPDSSKRTPEEEARERFAQAIYEHFEKDCMKKGWKKVLVKVGELERKLLWKGPEGFWKNGAIIALHGGGGACSNWGSGPRVGKPMDEFGDFAIKNGFAVFALDSTDGVVKDSKGRSYGKRWDCLAQDDRPNIDLPFIETVITKTIPELRPANSAEDMFITGLSTGGYMTILAATHFPGKIIAFAPVAGGDPYGAYFDLATRPRVRLNAPGVIRDCETNELISGPGAARAKAYPHEKEWPEKSNAKKPLFKQFHHQGDGVCDISCMEKANRLLIKHGYRDDSPFIMKDTGARTLLKHFWKKEYDRPIIEFFIKSRQVQPGLHERTVKVGAQKRKFLLYVPKSYNGAKAVPVVMMLHGGGGTGKAAMEETGWDKKAEKEGFLAVFPNATCPDPKKPPKFSTNSPTWNDGSGRFHAGEKDVPDVKYLSAVLDDVVSVCSVDDRRIYVTGFSNGASMTFRAGVELSERIAAIAPLAGAFWLKDTRLKRPVPALYITGTADTLNPLEGGFPRMAKGRRGIGGRKKPPVQDSIRRWADLLGCAEEPKETSEKDGVKRLLYSSAVKHCELVFITVEGMGHVWAGGTNKLPEWMVGSDPGKLDATNVVWEFFKKHTLASEK